ncbi:Os11g0223300, partial [Oryza sativa Japonica Group]
MLLKILLMSGFLAVCTKARQSNCPPSFRHSFCANVLLPTPPTPTIDTTLSSCASSVSHRRSSSIGPSIPTCSIAGFPTAGLRRWSIGMFVEEPRMESRLYLSYRLLASSTRDLNPAMRSIQSASSPP